MASGQVPLKPSPTVAPVAPDSTTVDSLGGGINVPASFRICPVDAKYRRYHENPHAAPSGPVVDPSAPLGPVLQSFTGCYRGKGFNLIFRPNNDVAGQNTTFDPPNFKPLVPNVPLGTVPNNNVLELNLTTETIHFSKPLGKVPNRGAKTQGDINLNGVPYLQTVNDVVNLDTGKADGDPVAIHFEPGLWMHVPKTDVDPAGVGETLSRMASIPHGTAINAQCIQPAQEIAGIDPIFEVADPTPFPIGTDPTNPANLKRFPAQTLTNLNTPRLPQDLTKFNDTGLITQKILDNPNLILQNDIDAQKLNGQHITKFFFFEVKTQPVAPILGGGVANIAFLEGQVTASGPNPPPGPNADVPFMRAQFWVETVQTKLTVPPFRKGQPPIEIHPKKGELLPVFVVSPPHDLHAPTEITTTFKQIQYTQTVLLDFAGLSWPHISVATLVQEYTHVPDSDFP